MGLFDDLLGGSKTPATPQATTADASGSDVIVNADTQEATESIHPSLANNVQAPTPAAIDDLLNASAGNMTADMPSYTAQKALESENDSTPIATDAIVSDVSVAETQTSDSIASAEPEMAPMISFDPIVEPANETPVAQTSENIVSETMTPAENSLLSLVESEDAPMITETVAQTQEEVAIGATDNNDTSSLFGGIMSEDSSVNAAPS